MDWRMIQHRHGSISSQPSEWYTDSIPSGLDENSDVGVRPVDVKPFLIEPVLRKGWIWSYCLEKDWGSWYTMMHVHILDVSRHHHLSKNIIRFWSARGYQIKETHPWTASDFLKVSLHLASRDNLRYHILQIFLWILFLCLDWLGSRNRRWCKCEGASSPKVGLRICHGRM